MVQIIDFGKSIPSSFSQSASLPVNSLPNSSVLGQFGVSVGTGGSVLIEGTFGLQNIGPNTSDIIISIVRNAVQVFSVRVSGQAVNNYKAVHFSFADNGMPAGYYGYAMIASSNSANNHPLIIGPLLFSGLSVQ